PSRDFERKNENPNRPLSAFFEFPTIPAENLVVHKSLFFIKGQISPRITQGLAMKWPDLTGRPPPGFSTFSHTATPSRLRSIGGPPRPLGVHFDGHERRCALFPHQRRSGRSWMQPPDPSERTKHPHPLSSKFL